MLNKTILVFCLACGMASAFPVRAATPAGAPDFASLIAKLSAPNADFCNADPDKPQANVQWLQFRLFSKVEGDLLTAANADPADTKAIARRLVALKRLADKRNKNSFDYTVTNMGKGIAVTVSIDGGTKFFFFAKPEVASVTAPWHSYGGADHATWQTSGKWIQFMRLGGGPPDILRFLVTTGWTEGCAGDRAGISYDVYQWQPTSEGKLNSIIDLEGGTNLSGNDDDYGLSDQPDEDVERFLKSDKAVETADGRLILQSCQVSPMDTWDHSSLCGVDVYEVTGDKVRYVETRPAYPDLRALATTIEYSRTHERQALNGYVATPALADTLIQTELPDAGDLVEVAKHSDGGEDVTMGWIAPDEWRVKYTLEKRDGNWIVTGYQRVPPNPDCCSPAEAK